MSLPTSVVLLFAVVVLCATATSSGNGHPTHIDDLDNDLALVESHPWYHIYQSKSRGIEATHIHGPSQPPGGRPMPPARLSRAAKTLSDIPAFNWVFGCSSVSGSMIACYYDRHGFPNMYTGPSNGGLCPSDNSYATSGWQTWNDGYTTYPNLPLAASHNGVDNRGTKGSIDDYWIQYNSGSADPYISAWTQHTWGTAIGDYMKTSQSTYGNTDGSTNFWSWQDNSQMTCDSDMITYTGSGTNKIAWNDGTYGRKLFYEARGYNVTLCYNQATDNKYAGGFSFAQYKAEIDAGHPVMINLKGHTVEGVGYDDTGQTVVLHDTWDYTTHTMVWGMNYSASGYHLYMQSVSIVHVTMDPPKAFVKVSPSDAATGQGATVQLKWQSALRATSYEYCYDTTNDNACSSWTSTTNSYCNATLTSLASGTYYWHVRAVNYGGTTYAGGSATAFWSFTVGGGSAPAAFGKTSPTNSATGQATSLTLSWGTSSGATSYTYCYATTTGCTNWQSATGTSATISGLSASTTYYWQARASNTYGDTTADGTTYWSFTTGALPGAFAKSAPTNSATGQLLSLTLSWGTSSGATSYTYCYATTTGCTSWQSATGTSVSISGLTAGTTYYWQARATNTIGSTTADGTTYWSFTTGSQPGAFAKSGPTNGATNQATSLTLSWGTSSGATSYTYCYATTTGCTSWQSATGTSVSISGLTVGTTYYWQARATNTIGSTTADGTTYWSFSTQALPGTFSKTAPTNSATGQSLTVQLTWGISNSATSYEYCYATTTGCSSYTSTTNTYAVPSPALTAGTTYYWQVRARNAAGTTDSTGGYFSFTTGALPGAFAKSSPANSATGQATSLTISWGASTNAQSYSYCYATTTGCTNWQSATGTSATISGLNNNQIYYWQVQATNSIGSTLGDGGTYWSFTTVSAPVPGAFGKSQPTNAATGVSMPPTISWAASTGATSYEYCYATTTGCSSWTSASTSTSASLSGLSNNQVYYWQARAVNANGNTQADGGTYWSFTTIVAAPGAFGKSSPTNSQTGVPTSATLQWAASTGATSYEYCYATTTGCSSWQSVTGTSASINSLTSSTVYYWQVRSHNAAGYTNADSSTYWSFTTAAALAPAAFSKSSPANSATGVSITTALSWGSSTGAQTYSYCIDTVTGCTSWTSTNTATTVSPSGLVNGQTYYWQVKAINANGETMANGGYFSFTTIYLPPATFGKSAPSDGATDVTITPALIWDTSAGATSYDYCYATTTGCTSWTNVVSTSVQLSTLSNGATYYWQVRAKNSGGTTEANGASAYWSFTTIAAAPGSFGKSSPSNNANGVSTTPTLQWGASSSATSYEYCVGTSTPCGASWTSIATTSVTLSSALGTSTQYYWQVRAKNTVDTVYANSGTEWSFTTAAFDCSSNPCNSHATCTATNTCTCNNGYNGDGHTCTPVCNTACGTHASCTAPDTCSCDTGYTGDGTTCSPDCSSNPCNAHATCTAPNTCQCSTGYTGDGHTCTATCTPTCGTHATCTAPNTCTCDNGYTGDGHTCTAVTSSHSASHTSTSTASSGSHNVANCTANPCGNHAACTGPNTCTCIDGYTGNGHTCSPDCSANPCSSHATCTAPNHCECNSGYEGDGHDCKSSVGGAVTSATLSPALLIVIVTILSLFSAI